MTAQPNTAVLVGGAAPLVLEPPQTEVRIYGRVESRIRLDRLESEIGGVPHAWFSAGFGLNPASGEEVRLEHMARRIGPGMMVTARLLRGGIFAGAARDDLVLFEGHIGRIEMNLDADGEGLEFEAEDLAGDLLRRRVGGQRLRIAGGSAELVEGENLVFNPDGRPNASPEPYAAGEEQYTIFAPRGSAGAVHWTLDKAVAYLLAEFGESDVVAVPSPSELSAAVGGLVIRDVSLEGRALGAALEALLELAGARLSISVEPQESAVSRRLEILTPGRAPVGWLAHQGAGGSFTPEATNVVRMEAKLHFDAAPRRYVARGDVKIYESTFDLVAGWDDALASYDPDTFSPSENPGFLAVRDVFRKWVLNEAGDYSDPPYSRGDAPDMSGLFEGARYARRRRRFLECLSRDALGRSHGIYVEMSLDGGTTWERSNLSTRVLAKECGIYLTDDPLPPRYLAAAMRGEVRVRVTASIESDARLVAERIAAGAAGLPGRTRHISVPAGYRYRKVASSSRFSGAGDADVADDTARLQELVDAAHEADRRCPAPTRIEVPYLALGRRHGERILGIRGRGLDLARQATGYESAPVLRRIRYTFAPIPQTEFELE